MANGAHPTVDELAQDCDQETERFRARTVGPAGACFELFRRAIVERCQEAWEAVYTQYHRLLLHWVGGSPIESQDLAQHALEKFFAAVTPEIFARFSSISAVIGYLKRCARGVHIDRERKQASERRAWEALQVVDPVYAASPEQAALDRICNEQYVAHIYHRLEDDQERRVVYLSFELDLKPSEIVSRFPAEFSSAHCVSRIKERVLRRLAQDPILQAAYGASS